MHPCSGLADKDAGSDRSPPRIPRSERFFTSRELEKHKIKTESHMKIRTSLILGFALLFGSITFAQDSPKAEITGDYSYFRLNPGLPSVWNSQNLNGGGA